MIAFLLYRLLWWTHSAYRFTRDRLRVIVPVAFILVVLIGTVCST